MIKENAEKVSDFSNENSVSFDFFGGIVNTFGFRIFLENREWIMKLVIISRFWKKES